MEPYLRWPLVISGMLLGYLAGGPLGGFIGLGVGYWLSRRPRRAAPPTLPDEIRAAYRTLGVKPRASNESVREAYRRLMSRHHPDKLGPEAGPDEREAARRQTVAVRDAFDRIRRRRGLH